MNVSQKDSAVHSKIHLIVAFHKYSDLEMPADTEQAQQIFERTPNTDQVQFADHLQVKIRTEGLWNFALQIRMEGLWNLALYIRIEH